LRIYIGYDPRDDAAFKVAVKSIRQNFRPGHSHGIEIIPLKDNELRAKGIYRRTYCVTPKGQMLDTMVEGRLDAFSTQFSFTRYLIPELEHYSDEWVLFMDADVMIRADISELFALADDRFDVMCVPHDHQPTESRKMDGVEQVRYGRKNWSSVMLMKPSGCRQLTPWAVNNWQKSVLHSMSWANRIGELPVEWNYLAGYNTQNVDPKIVHFTLGTPDMQRSGFAPSTKWDTEWREYHRACP
jgi:lipopolysaccharide biosynthesis glycosyltransferase